jgi:hypothetical protein
MAEPATKSEAEGPTSAPAAYSINAIHALRTVQLGTLTLSQMADQKASMLMGASFVVFSIAVGRTLAAELAWPLAILAFFAFLSALFAALAVMPSIGAPPRHGGASANRLFFGHFAGRDEQEWTGEVLAELQADEAVFRLMLHDIYQNGQVLQRRKYRYLVYAYRIFVIGLLATLAAFALELSLAAG